MADLNLRPNIKPDVLPKELPYADQPREVLQQWIDFLHSHTWRDMNTEIGRLRTSRLYRTLSFRPDVKFDSAEQFLEIVEDSHNKLKALFGYMVGAIGDEPCRQCATAPQGPFTECVFFTNVEGGCCMNCLWSVHPTVCEYYDDDEDPGRNFGAPLHERAREAYKEAKAWNSKHGNHGEQMKKHGTHREKMKLILYDSKQRKKAAQKQLAKFKNAIDTYPQ